MPTLDPLSALAVKYKSDKWSAKHSYTAWYWEQFKDRRESVRKVVEIGVGEGASLRMWREFFPNAEIWGADNDWTRLFNDGRIHVTLCDQSKWDDLDNLLQLTGTDIDLFVDDGSHLLDHQSVTCGVLMRILKYGVTYVIEDVNSPHLEEYFNFRGWDSFEAQLEKRHRSDNRLIVVKHKCPQPA